MTLTTNKNTTDTTIFETFGVLLTDNDSIILKDEWSHQIQVFAVWNHYYDTKLRQYIQNSKKKEETSAVYVKAKIWKMNNEEFQVEYFLGSLFCTKLPRGNAGNSARAYNYENAIGSKLWLWAESFNLDFTTSHLFFPTNTPGALLL